MWLMQGLQLERGFVCGESRRKLVAVKGGQVQVKRMMVDGEVIVD